MSSTTDNKRVRHLVVDSSAFIRQAPLHLLTDTVYTVEDVVKEIRDLKTRESLNVVLYKLNFKEPSTEATRFVTNYAKKTGDFASLSAVDMRLLALTYQLYEESVGVEKLNLEPKINAVVPSTSTCIGRNGVKLAGFVVPKNEESSTDEGNSSESPIESPEATEQTTMSEVPSIENEIDNEENQLSEIVDELDLGHDDDGWITPSNINRVKSKAFENGVCDNTDVNETLPVACITTDFAMQNVLIQMGIPVISVDGLLIRTARSYILKCRVCPGLTHQMNKQFCPECGNPSLQKAGITIDQSGKRQYTLIGRYRPKPRESVGLPRGGKHTINPIRVEGQPRPQNRPSKKSLDRKSVV